MKEHSQSKKGQIEFSILVFIAVIVGLLVIAPIMLKIVNTILTPFGSSIGNQSVMAGASVTKIQGSFTDFWDWVIVIAFLVNIILLLVSSFLIDTHPIFMIIFIVFGIFTFIFAPMVLDAVDKIYEQPTFTGATDGTDITTQIPMTDFLRTNLNIILLGIYFLCGIIIYSKFKMLGGGNTLY
jgi:hypothetical protein